MWYTCAHEKKSNHCWCALRGRVRLPGRRGSGAGRGRKGRARSRRGPRAGFLRERRRLLLHADEDALQVRLDGQAPEEGAGRLPHGRHLLLGGARLHVRLRLPGPGQGQGDHPGVRRRPQPRARGEAGEVDRRHHDPGRRALPRHGLEPRAVEGGPPRKLLPPLRPQDAPAPWPAPDRRLRLHDALRRARSSTSAT